MCVQVRQRLGRAAGTIEFEARDRDQAATEEAACEDADARPEHPIQARVQKPACRRIAGPRRSFRAQVLHLSGEYQRAHAARELSAHLLHGVHLRLDQVRQCVPALQSHH